MRSSVIEETTILFEQQVAKRNAFNDKENIHQIFSAAMDIINESGTAKEVASLEEATNLSRLTDYCIGEWNFAKNYAKEDIKGLDYDVLSRRAALKYSISYSDETQNHDPFAISYYDPLVATLSSACSFFEKINGPLARHNPSYSLINDLFESLFKKIHGTMEMMILGLYTDAFSAWRTIHESECIIRLLLSGGDRIRRSYLNHIAYNNYLRNNDQYTQEELDSAFEVIKAKRKEHGLSAKDTKKFIEYGWLYDHPDWNFNDPTAKLNFRDGVERVAKLTEYSKIYETSSEIAHSSSFFFYANDEFCRDISLRMVYQSSERVFLMYYDHMYNGYFSRNPELKELALESIRDVSLISRKIFKEEDFPREEEEIKNEPQNH